MNITHYATYDYKKEVWNLFDNYDNFVASFAGGYEIGYKNMMIFCKASDDVHGVASTD